MSRAKKCLTRESQIKELPQSVFAKLCQLLNVNEAWKQMISFIRTRQNDGERFSIDNVQQFELSRDSSKEMLNAWSVDCVSLGRLVGVLESAQLQREAKLITEKFSDSEATQPIRRVETPPKSQIAPLPPFPSSHPNSEHIRYTYLAQCTNNFDTTPLMKGGCFIGEGGSADVFRGIEPGSHRQIAVKRLKANQSGSWEQFLNELDVLSVLGEHQNLVLFLGLSRDGPVSCIVYEYMVGGSLLERLASPQRLGVAALTRLQRVTIARDMSYAIQYIHSRNLIHRDVKTANILLDCVDRAKLGDYGITRRGPSDSCETSTQNLIGTQIYMPIEYIRDGELSFKTDSYSFGVVLLEILTGLPPNYCARDERNIVSYIQEYYTPDNILQVVDYRVADGWESSNAVAIYNLAKKLLRNKNTRPLISDCLKEIELWL